MDKKKMCCNSDIFPSSPDSHCSKSFSGIENRILIIDLQERETLPMKTLLELSKKHKIPIQNIIIRDAKSNPLLKDLIKQSNNGSI